MEEENIWININYQRSGMHSVLTSPSPGKKKIIIIIIVICFNGNKIL